VSSYQTKTAWREAREQYERIEGCAHVVGDPPGPYAAFLGGRQICQARDDRAAAQRDLEEWLAWTRRDLGITTKKERRRR
jgi:hypothetical protein